MAKLSMDGFLRSVKLIPNRDDDRYDDDYDDYEEDDELDEAEEDPAPRRNTRTSRFGRKAVAPAYDEKDDYYDDEDAEDSSSYYSAPARSQQAVTKAVGAVSGTAQRGAASSRNAKRTDTPSASDVNVRIFHPKTIEDANAIADELVSDKIVVMNLEEVDMAAAQRIVDFVSGACYSVDGNLQKIAKKAFIVTPKNANLSSEMGNIIREAVGLSSVNIMK